MEVNIYRMKRDMWVCGLSLKSSSLPLRMESTFGWKNVMGLFAVCSLYILAIVVYVGASMALMWVAQRRVDNSAFEPIYFGGTSLVFVVYMIPATWLFAMAVCRCLSIYAVVVDNRTISIYQKWVCGTKYSHSVYVNAKDVAVRTECYPKLRNTKCLILEFLEPRESIRVAHYDAFLGDPETVSDTVLTDDDR